MRLRTGPHAQLKRKVLVYKNKKQRVYPVVKEANRDDDLHMVVEQEAAFDQLGLTKLIFVDRVDTSRLSFPMNFFVVFFTCNNY